MRRTNTAEILETCLRRMAAGDSQEAVLADYPDQAGEIRELLRLVAAAQPAEGSMRVPSHAQQDSRRRMLARAKELEGQRPTFSLADALRFFSAHLGTVAFVATAAVMLIVAMSSVNALPGDGLYPIKLAAEEAGILMGSSDPTQLEREAGLETQRAEMVLAMIRAKQSGAARFSGFLNRSPLDGWQAAGISLDLSQEMELRAGSLAGLYVEVEGNLNTQGRVQVASLSPVTLTIRGVVSEINGENWQVGSQAVRVTAATEIQGSPARGSDVTVDAARPAGSDRLLALRVAETPEPTASPEPSFTPAPTSTQIPTITPTPSATPSPTQPPAVIPTVQPTSSSDDSSDHSGSGGDSGDDHSKEDDSSKDKSGGGTDDSGEHSGKDGGSDSGHD